MSGADDDFGLGMVWAVVAVLALCVIAFAGAAVGRSMVESDAVEQGVAQYNPQTREFEWLSEASE